MASSGKLIVITGPSGAGKSTITHELLRRTDAVYSVSATTRDPRPGEVEGRDYVFLDRQEFRRQIDAGEFLEWAEVFGELYGTPAEPVREPIAAGRTVVVEIDVQGGLQVAKTMPEADYVLILPPDRAELERRLRRRRTEDEATLQRRLAKADEEIRLARSSGVYNHQIVNEDLETAVQEVVRIVNAEPEKA